MSGIGGKASDEKIVEMGNRIWGFLLGITGGLGLVQGYLALSNLIKANVSIEVVKSVPAILVIIIIVVLGILSVKYVKKIGFMWQGIVFGILASLIISVILSFYNLPWVTMWDAIGFSPGDWFRSVIN